jgi:hypothetical protein
MCLPIFSVLSTKKQSAMSSRKQSVHFDVVHSDSEHDEPATGNSTKPRRGAPKKRTKQIANKAAPGYKKKVADKKKKVRGPIVKSNVQPATAVVRRRSNSSKKGRITGVRASAESIMQYGTKLNKAIDDTWALAPKSDMYLRGCKKDSSKKRTQNLIRNAALDIASSGAAADLFNDTHESSKMFNLTAPVEQKSAPWHPATSKGARLQINMFCAAYAQQAIRNATVMRDSNHKKRISAEMMEHSFELAGPQFFSGGNLGIFTPSSTYMGEIKSVVDKERKQSSMRRSVTKARENSGV